MRLKLECIVIKEDIKVSSHPPFPSEFRLTFDLAFDLRHTSSKSSHSFHDQNRLPAHSQA